MPMYNPGTVVVEDFSEPLTRPDGSAEVFVYTHILYPGCTPGDATLSSTRKVELTKEEVDFVRQAQSTAPGQSVKELLGAAILSLLSQTHRIRGTFPEDYIPTLAAGVPT
jgi:hypothetical protein